MRGELKSALKLVYAAVVADVTLGEEPDHFACIQRLADAFDRAFAHARSDRNDAENFKKPLQIPQIVVAAMHHEAHPARAGKLHHRPIDPADMVA